MVFQYKPRDNQFKPIGAVAWGLVGNIKRKSLTRNKDCRSGSNT